MRTKSQQRPASSNSSRLMQASQGAARMVDVVEKPPTHRVASAEAYVQVGPVIALAIRQHGGGKKGSVQETARIAGIMAAKRTTELIPQCHWLSLARQE